MHIQQIISKVKQFDKISYIEKAEEFDAVLDQMERDKAK